MLVFYRGQVGYAPTISQALKQVGIDSKAAQDIELVDEGAAESQDNNGADEQPKEGDSEAPAPGNKDEAMQGINDALRNLEGARDGSFEEYGRALDELDRAVEAYQNAQ